MRRITTTFAMALCLLGCSTGPPGEPVDLVTAPASPCYVYAREVLLIADPTVGVVARYTQETPGQTVPVVWPLGYVGRRDGSEVVVYDGDGVERARTGTTAFLFNNDLRNEPLGSRATCLHVTPESKPGWSPSALGAENVRRLSLPTPTEKMRMFAGLGGPTGG